MAWDHYAQSLIRLSVLCLLISLYPASSLDTTPGLLLPTPPTPAKVLPLDDSQSIVLLASID